MKRNLKTVAQICEGTPFTENTVRWWVFHSQSNGLAHALIRIGRRVYIDADAFDAWIDSHNEKPL